MKNVIAHSSPEPLAKQQRLDLSHEAWWEYIYPRGETFVVVGAIMLILDKRPEGDRHRLIIKEKTGESGMYIRPGWLAIRWQGKDGTSCLNVGG